MATSVISGVGFVCILPIISQIFLCKYCMAHIQLYFKAIYTTQVSINRAGVIYIGHRVRRVITVQEINRRDEARKLLAAEREAYQIQEKAWQLSKPFSEACFVLNLICFPFSCYKLPSLVPPINFLNSYDPSNSVSNINYTSSIYTYLSCINCLKIALYVCHTVLTKENLTNNG